LTLLPALVSPPSPGLAAEQIRIVIDGMDVSDSTRVQYQREIKVFANWLGAAPFYANVLLDFKMALRARSDLSGGTKAKYLMVARSFLRELYRLRILPMDVTVNVKGIRTNHSHKKTPISDEEIARVFEFLNSDAADPRARLIIALMYFLGFRRIEVCRLFVEDLTPWRARWRSRARVKTIPSELTYTLVWRRS
jgi:site-specific recombinase XerD